MLNVYIEKPDVSCNMEAFIEHEKGILRAKVNEFLKDKIFNLDEFSFKMKIIKFINTSKDYRVYQIKDLMTLQLIKLISLEEITEMFRQEIEWHVIRRKMPVLLSEEDGFIKLRLPPSRKAEALLFRYPHFTFKEAEHFVKSKVSEIERVQITGSKFENETNLIAVFKIK